MTLRKPSARAKRKLAKNTSIAILGAAIAVCSTSAALADSRQYNIPAGSLATALNKLAESSGMQLVYDTSIAGNRQTNGLTGKYSLETAMQQLLGNSGLSYRITGNNTIVIEKRPLSSKQEPIALKGITVTGQALKDANDPYNTDYNRSNAATATKTDTPIMETPMSIQVVPRAAIQDQQAVQIGDAVKNVSGVFPDFTWGGYSEGFMVRGFSSNNGGSYLDGFRWPVSRISLANVERVEVVKGAASNLYGRIEPGGMINVVTKRPQATPYYSLEQRFGSYDFYQTLGDATGALNKDGSLMYRLNFEYLDKKSFRDFAFTDRVLVAPSVTWKISDRTQLDLDFLYSNEDTLEDHGVVASLTTRRPVDIPISTFLGEPSTDKSRTEIFYTGVSLKHAFSDNWAVRTRFNMQQRNALDLQHPGTPGLNEATGMLNRAFFGGGSGSDTYFGTIDVTGKFSTWGVKHDVLAGLDHYSVTGDVSSYFFGPTIFRGPIQPISIYNPVYGLSGLNLDTAQKSQFLTSETDWTGVYFQDQITLFDKLHILGGGRYDWASQASGAAYGTTRTLADAKASESSLSNQRFSPRVGLLYQPWNWLSLYGNYVESLGAANAARNPSGQVLQPEIAEQYEVGFKTEFFDKRLMSSVAFYDLTKQNLAVAMAGTPFSQAIGEARSRGVEVDVAGKVTDGLNLIATYAYTDALILKGNNAGNRLWNVPRNAGSFWAKYDLQQPALRGLSVGAGVYFQSQKEGDTANSFELPGYGRVDALVKYQLPIAKAKTTLQFNVENLLDHKYYASTVGWSPAFVNPGAPRTFMGSIKIEY